MHDIFFYEVVHFLGLGLEEILNPIDFAGESKQLVPGLVLQILLVILQKWDLLTKISIGYSIFV